MHKKNKIHYAWWILVSCCALQGGTLGVIQNCRGLFYSPVCTQYGFTLGSFTLQQMFFGVFTVAALPLVRKMLEKCNIRVLVTAALILFDLSTALMSIMSTLWEWYLLASLQGFAGAFLIFYTPPLLLNSWFHEKKGLAIGISGASAGLFGIIANIIGAAVITSAGWRDCYIVIAVMSFIVAAPFTVFVMCKSPYEKGLTPYGLPEGEKESAQGIGDGPATLGTSKKTVGYVIITAMLLSLVSTISQHFPNYAVQSGLTLVTGALMASFAMGGNVACKFLLGFLNDRLSVKKASFIAIGASILSLMIIPLSGTILPLVFAGDVINGFSMALCAVQPPLIATSLFDKKSFPRLLMYVIMATSFFSAAGTTVIGYIHDIFGNYLPVFIICIALSVISAAMLAAAYRSNRIYSARQS